MTKDKQDSSFQFYYDEVGEKELLEQLTDSYQSGYDYTVTQQEDPQYQSKKEGQ
ncbi:hypothetical protein [Bacillus pinisoli]|uniref:hypothetical protein n=1 Tax=Bacillus pinisoli TaxID=2901866 RepID=UPI001FF2C148|nr:hypothetical protein [Bacillus pinisoli]